MLPLPVISFTAHLFYTISLASAIFDKPQKSPLWSFKNSNSNACGYVDESFGPTIALRDV
jgi:hypothetical protein